MMIMKKMYDVCFTLAEDACVTVEANNEAEAELFFEHMTKDELIERIRDAVEFMGVEISYIEEVD